MEVARARQSFAGGGRQGEAGIFGGLRYTWQHAAQLAAYVVFAAMCGEPWPIRRAGIYQPRHGRMLWLDVAQLAQTRDLLAFGTWLISRGSRRHAADSAVLMDNLAANLAQLPRVVTRTVATPPAVESVVHAATARDWVRGVLREFPDDEMTVTDLYRWQVEPRAFDKYTIAMALEDLKRLGTAVGRRQDGERHTWWALSLA